MGHQARSVLEWAAGTGAAARRAGIGCGAGPRALRRDGPAPGEYGAAGKLGKA